MFGRHCATGKQSQAIQEINSRWGQDVLNRIGREHIGIPVCKKKFKPFAFHVKKPNKDGTFDVDVERMYACKCHNTKRIAVIQQNGLRDGWEPFGQWSLRKAQEMAKREAERLKQGGETSSDESSSDLCAGNCTWKVKSAYDDIYKEMHGESEEEEYYEKR
jgi:hypothetical protein